MNAPDSASGGRRAVTAPYSGRVMISSAMRGYGVERAALAQVIRELGLTPWYAEEPPAEFAGVSGETLSFEMAARCDLYLLIIFPRYGSQVYADDTRAVTHLEFERALIVPRRVRAFIAQEAWERADSEEADAEELRDFIAEIKNFQSGISPTMFTSPDELYAQVRSALERWQADGQLGRDIYVEAVTTEYHLFRNPATGQEMEFSATIPLKARARLTHRHVGAQWDDQTGGDEERTYADAHAGTDREPEAPQVSPTLVTVLLAEHQRLVLLGDSGAGKTTLLQRLVHDAADAYQRGQGFRLPILVTVARLAATARRHPNEPLSEVVALAQEEGTRTDALRPTIRSAVSGAVANGQALLLVDGLDEANVSEQTAVLALLAQVGANWAILASRPNAYRGQLVGWRAADLQPLDTNQRRQLSLEIFRVQNQEDGRQVADPFFSYPQTSMLELEAAIRARQSDLAAWAGNPLLATLIDAQYARDHRLPGNRADIYEFAIEDLQRQRPSTVRRRLSNLDLRRMIEILALGMQQSLLLSVTVAQARDSYLREGAGCV